MDGSLRDSDWHAQVFAALRRDRPHYRIVILFVSCSRETMHQRAERRARATGRVVPPELLDQTYDQVEVRPRIR